MPKHRPPQNFSRRDILQNKLQAVQAQSVSFGQSEAIKEISASYSSTAALRVTQRGTADAFCVGGTSSLSGSLNVIGNIRINSVLLDALYASLSHSHTLTFPTGSVFLTNSNTNPNTLLGYGTWNSLGSGALFSATVYSWERTA